MLSACVIAGTPLLQTNGIDVSLLGTDWRINPIVLRVEWWFDGKHFLFVNHMKSTAGSLYFFSSCLQRVRRATRLVSDSCCARRRLTHLSWRSQWIILCTGSRWMSASQCDLTNRSVRFWIVFLNPDWAQVLRHSQCSRWHTHRTWSATARLPINRTRSSDFL